jgi:hypothetical protein
MTVANILSTSTLGNVSTNLSAFLKAKYYLTALVTLCCTLSLAAQSEGIIFEFGYNITSTYLDQVPANSPLTTLQERKSINGLHIAAGQRQPLSNLFKIEYALVYDLLGFDAVNEQDRHKTSNLGGRLMLLGNLTDKLSFAAGGTGYVKSWGDALDEKSIYFDPFLKQKSYFLTANARVSYAILKELDAFASYHFNFTPLYTYDFAANQFPLNLKLYYRFVQLGVGYRISTKPDRLNIQRDQ